MEMIMREVKIVNKRILAILGSLRKNGNTAKMMNLFTYLAK